METLIETPVTVTPVYNAQDFNIGLVLAISSSVFIGNNNNNHFHKTFNEIFLFFRFEFHCKKDWVEETFREWLSCSGRRP